MAEEDPPGLDSVANLPAAPVINAIDKSSILQICSSQVVLDLATAVKELVENSLDAGATTVEIRIKDNGAGGVEVQDNGPGVDPSQYAALTKRYATSKIKKFSDLEKVSSFGFRGEALSSLAATARLSIVSKTAAQNHATEVEYDQAGEIISQKPAVGGVGTTVQIRDLFRTLPVRQKEFVKNIKREYTKVVASLQNYAIICTETKFTVLHQDKKGTKSKVLSTAGSKSLRDTITSIYGQKFLLSMVSIEAELEPFKITGFVSKLDPKACKTNSSQQHLFLNKRPIEHPKVARTVNEVFRTLNPGLLRSGHYPAFVLCLDMPPDEYDVNVTPDKKMVYFVREQPLIKLLQNTLNTVFRDSGRSFEVESLSLPDEEPYQPSRPSKASQRSQSTPSIVPSMKIKRQPAPDENTEEETEADEDQEAKLRLDRIDSFGLTGASTSPRRARTPSPTKQAIIRSSTLTAQVLSFPARQSTTPLTMSDTTIEDGEHEHDGRCSHHSTAELDQTPTQRLSSLSSSQLSRSGSRGNARSSESMESTRQQLLSDLMSLKSSLEDEDDTNAEKKEDVFIKDEADEEKTREEALGEFEEVKAEVDGEEDVVMDAPSEQSEVKQTKAKFSMKRLREATKARHQRILDQRVKDEPNGSEGKRFITQMNVAATPDIEAELSRLIQKDHFAQMKVIGQFNRGFIVTQMGSDLFILDQHASDEKYNFEQLKATFSMNRQKLFKPLQLELSALDEMVVCDNMSIFQMNGFDFEVDESKPTTQRLSLVAYPFSQNTEFGIADVMELVTLLKDRPGEVVRLSRVRAHLASRACRKSYMVGDPLDHQTMTKVVRHMQTMTNPWNCPHGRPTMRHLIDLSQIEHKVALAQEKMLEKKRSHSASKFKEADDYKDDSEDRGDAGVSVKDEEDQLLAPVPTSTNTSSKKRKLVSLSSQSEETPSKRQKLGD